VSSSGPIVKKDNAEPIGIPSIGLKMMSNVGTEVHRNIPGSLNMNTKDQM
jgi:hypothetical protein